ncbi:hypothetical protein EVAR_57157_1 [Eumeta japonica]|uniref:Uncharacterized protein n=1 Tax=Eumeta variegata TaxID=151549 RepID=A0A4C1YV98_EUMVA|nr:hypothetical protein EVAR_57157_1 [Eumeta japonica]
MRLGSADSLSFSLLLSTFFSLSLLRWNIGRYSTLLTFALACNRYKFSAFEYLEMYILAPVRRFASVDRLHINQFTILILILFSISTSSYSDSGHDLDSNFGVTVDYVLGPVFYFESPLPSKALQCTT